MQRKHEGVERDLAALEDRVGTLGEEASRLCSLHAPNSTHINAKKQEIQSAWQLLITKAKVIYKFILHMYKQYVFNFALTMYVFFTGTKRKARIFLYIA